MVRLAKTLSIQTGRKLADKSREDIVKAVHSHFSTLNVVAIQIGYEVIRVTFSHVEDYKKAMSKGGVRLFGLYCKILGGGPPITIVHVFDYPFEEDESFLETVFNDFGEVRGTKKQTYLFNTKIYTGTRLVSLVPKVSPPRSLTINGYICRVWYKGQPLVCNLCGVQGHKSSACPNRDKCRRCGEAGHFARACPRTFDGQENEAGASGFAAPPPFSSAVSRPAGDSHRVFSSSATPAEEQSTEDVGASPPPSAASASVLADPVEDGSVSLPALATGGVSDPVEDDSVPPPALVSNEFDQNAVVPVDPVEDGSVSTPAPASGGVSDPVEGSSVSPPAPVSGEVSPSGECNYAAEAYAFTCGQAMPDSQMTVESDQDIFESQVSVVPSVGEGADQNVVILEEGWASGQPPDPDLHPPGNESDVVGSGSLVGDPPDSLDSLSMDESPPPLEEVPPSQSDGVKDTIKKSRLGRYFKRSAPYSKKEAVHSMPAVVSDRPGPGQRTKR